LLSSRSSEAMALDDEKFDMSAATLAPDEGEPVDIEISVSLVSGKSLVLSRPSTEQVGQLKQVAAERLGLSGEEVVFIQDGDTIPDSATVASLHGTSLDLVALSPGSIAAVVDNRVVVASGSTLKIQTELDYSKSTRRSPYHLQWSPTDAAHLALRSQNMAWIHDFSMGKEVFARPCRGGKNSIKWCPDGSKLALVSGVMHVDVCVLNPASDFRLVQRSETYSLTWHPSGSQIAVGQDDGIAIFDVESRAEENFLRVGNPVELVDWHSGGCLLACGDNQGALRVMTTQGETRWQLRQCDAALQMGLQDNLACISWCPKHTLIAFCSCSGTAIQLFDADSGKLVWKSIDYCPFTDICWNNDGTKVAGSCQDGHVYVLNAKTGETLGSLDVGRANSLSWSRV